MADDGTSFELPSADQTALQQFADLFPNGLPGKRPRASSAILSHFPLSESDLLSLATHAETGESLNTGEQNQLKDIRHTHHKLAMLLAAGVDESIAAQACNYGVATVSVLKSDPLFAQLLELYTDQVVELRKDTVAVMADMQLDVLAELQRRLTLSPDSFTVPALTELMKALSDRSGNGPSSNVNANVTTVSLTGDELARLKTSAIVGSHRVVEGSTGSNTPQDRSPALGEGDGEALEHSAQLGEEGDGSLEGGAVRSEGDSDAALGDVVPLAVP